MTKQKPICPICGEIVTEYSPEHGGTVTDKEERRWHLDCYQKINV